MTQMTSVYFPVVQAGNLEQGYSAGQVSVGALAG